MIITANYDESGTHQGSPVTVLAGFVGTANDWAGFEREWQKVLTKHGITHVRCKQLEHKQGLHKGWSNKQVEYLWADLIYVLQEWKDIFASKTLLWNHEYDQFYLKPKPERRERIDSKYALCLRCFLHFNAPFHYGRYGGGSVNFVLEAGHRNAGDALRVFNEIKNDKRILWRDSLGAIAFGAKKEFPALQAADLLAYWFYKTEIFKLEYEGLERPYEQSFLERELIDSGITVLHNLITPYHLKEMRRNFQRKRPRPLFGVAEVDGSFTVDPSSPYVRVQS